MATRTDCYPWWHATLSKLLAQPWARSTIPSGCGGVDGAGNIPCAPEAMRAASEAWLAKNYPQVLAMLGGRLTLDVYTYGRYMESEVGSGTIEERVAVGEAGLNQAKASGRTISKMLMPTGYYGPIHAPDTYCASIGKGPGCAPYGRWAATTKAPTIGTLLIANFVVSGQSGNFANDALTQWGPDAVRSPSPLTSPERIASFVRSAANNRYYWVGPLPGVDPWHTWLTFKGPAASTLVGQGLIARGISALPLNANGTPRRASWPTDLPVCEGGAPIFGGLPGAELVLALLGLAAGIGSGIYFNRWVAKSV